MEKATIECYTTIECNEKSCSCYILLFYKKEKVTSPPEETRGAMHTALLFLVALPFVVASLTQPSYGNYNAVLAEQQLMLRYPVI